MKRKYILYECNCKRDIWLAGRALEVGEDRVQGIAGGGESQFTALVDKSAQGDGEEIIGAVAADHVFGREAVQISGSFPDYAGARFGVQAEAGKVEFPSRSYDFW